MASGELISCSQDRLRRVTAFAPDQLISCGRGETVLGEESFRSQSVVLLNARTTSALVT